MEETNRTQGMRAGHGLTRVSCVLVFESGSIYTASVKDSVEDCVLSRSLINRNLSNTINAYLQRLCFACLFWFGLVWFSFVRY